MYLNNNHDTIKNRHFLTKIGGIKKYFVPFSSHAWVDRNTDRANLLLPLIS
jgi:hypothetical protein